MHDVDIRKLSYDDYTRFLPLIKEFRPTTFTEDEFIARLKEIENTSEIYVAQYDNKLIGTATIVYEKKFIYDMTTLAHIEDVVVASEYKGRGVGKMLIARLVDQAKHHACYKVVLDCVEENIPFYSSCKFERKGVQMVYIVS
jgi:glucosamine-phosphate N-acetyltransferase